MIHDIVITHYRGHKSAKCSCGTGWTRVGYGSVSELRGENDMLEHARAHHVMLLRVAGR